MLKNNKFGASGHNVVIEEFLEGIELSCFVLTDGNSYKILPYAKDYKRIGEGDKGLTQVEWELYHPFRLLIKSF
jgi:phosphoribosylamine--glycine ligase